MSPSPRATGWPLVILLGTIVLIGFAVVMPVAEMFAEQGDDIAQARQDFVAYRAQIAARPSLASELESLDRQGLLKNALLPGNNAALAAAGMQDVVKRLIERHAGQVRSAQALETSASAGLEKVVVQFEVTVPLGSLKAVTYELETSTPYLFLDAVEIRPEIYAEDATATPRDVHVQWTVHGYRRAEMP